MGSSGIYSKVQMRRREFLTLLGGSTVAWPLAAPAQQPVKRIGIINFENPEPLWSLLRQSLGDLGYVEGRNVAFKFRSADGNGGRLPGIASELVRLDVDLIVAYQTPAVIAAKEAIPKIPIVLFGIADPVGMGIVASLSRPGGNITGTSSTTPEISVKALELIRELMPAARHVIVLLSAADPFSKSFLNQLALGAPSLGLQIEALVIQSADELEPAFAAMSPTAPDAVIVQPSLPLGRVASLALDHRVMALSVNGTFVREGGLAAYSTSGAELARNTAAYVDRILKGDRPADLPIVQPTKFEWSINLRTAKALGLTIAPTTLARADNVIE
jgi:putative ABC transport system substrate-binding protein